MSKYISRYFLSYTFVAGFLIVVLCSMTLAPSLLSQSGTTGALSGTLRDSSGAIVPNATVTLTSLATAQVRTTTTIEHWKSTGAKEAPFTVDKEYVADLAVTASAKGYDLRLQVSTANQ